MAVHASALGGIDILKVDSAGNFRDISEVQLSVEVLTNVQTGTIRINISGGGKFTGNVNAPGPPFAFTLVGTGAWGWPRNPDHPTELGIFVTTGRFVETVDSQETSQCRGPVGSATCVPNWLPD